MTKLILAVLIGYLLSSAISVRAQEPTPEPGPNAAKMLPDPTSFGNGWTLSETVSPDILARYSFEMSPDVFREGAAGVYLGPDGARIVLVSLLLTENRVAIRKSWEDAGNLLNNAGLRINNDYSRDKALETMEPPAGCVEAKRIEGIETFFLQPAGGTMCAVDPDAVLLAVAFGNFSGKSGVEASDAVIELATTT